MADISFLTVALSAGASVCTGFIGVLLNNNRQRQRQRRIYGLALLAEVKALQKLARQYYGSFSQDGGGFESSRMPKLQFSSADTAVFNNVAGNVGLFSTRTAVAIIEYYSSVRNLVAQAQSLVELQDKAGYSEVEMRRRLADHLGVLRIARRHGGMVVVTLRRETPTDLDQTLRACRRRLTLQARNWRHRFKTDAVKHKASVRDLGP